MITLRQIERQFGIPLAPADGLIRISLYLRISGESPGQRRLFLERELHSQFRNLSRLERSRLNEGLLAEFMQRLTARLALLDLDAQSGGLAVFGDQKQIWMSLIPRLAESFAVVSESFHIRPLLRLPEFFSRYVIVTLHGGHAAAYLREGQSTKKLFSFTPPPVDDSDAGRAEKKRIRSARTMDFAAAQIAALSDASVLVFGPRYLRTRFRKLLAKSKLRPPAFEADADVPLGGLVERADRIMGQDAPDVAKALREQVDVAGRDGRLAVTIPEIFRAAALGAIETFVITSPEELWSEAALPQLRGQIQGGSAIPTWSKQNSYRDDCLLDDVGETVLRSGGSVAELPLLRNLGTPAFAILRWRTRYGAKGSATESKQEVVNG
jgi:hypothetical protein